MRHFFSRHYWSPKRRQPAIAWIGAISLNLVLFSLLSLTMKLRIGFDMPDQLNPLPIEVITAQDYAALTEPEPEPLPEIPPAPEPEPVKQLRIEPPKPKPEPKPEITPEPEKQPEPEIAPIEEEPAKEPETKPIEIPDITLTQEEFTLAEPEVLPLIEPEIVPDTIIEEDPFPEQVIEDLPIAETIPVEEVAIAEIAPEQVPETIAESDPLIEEAPVEAATVEEALIEELPEEVPPLEENDTVIETADTTPEIEDEIQITETPTSDIIAITEERPEDDEDEDIGEIAASDTQATEINGPTDLPPVANAPPATDANNPYAGLTGDQIDQLYKQKSKLPSVALPQTAGGSSGVTAIFCPEVFTNEDKIQECAGRPEIRSGYQAGNEDWSEVIDSLKRGGVATQSNPSVGPATDRNYPYGARQAAPSPEEAILGRGLAADIRDAELFKDTKARSLGVQDVQKPDMGEGVGVQSFITDTWEPSWTLRDDPYIDQKVLEELIESANPKKDEKKE